MLPTPPPYSIPSGVKIPAAGDTITQEQAKFIAHLAGMTAMAAAEAGSATEVSRDALLSASITPLHGLQKFQLGMMWTMEKVAKILEGKEIGQLDDFAITYLLYLDPKRAAALADAGDASALIAAARAATDGLTIEQSQTAMAHIAKEMEFFQRTQVTEEKKPVAAAVTEPPPSHEIDQPQLMDGPSIW